MRETRKHQACPPPCAEYDDVEGRKEVLQQLLGSFDEGGWGPLLGA